MHHPPGIGAFEFVVLASLRAIQLTRGCRPRIDSVHKNTVIAQIEGLQGKVVQALCRRASHATHSTRCKWPRESI
jgi:DNA-directed RNA polymerase subunit K/omega